MNRILGYAVVMLLGGAFMAFSLLEGGMDTGERLAVIAFAGLCILIVAMLDLLYLFSRALFRGAFRH